MNRHRIASSLPAVDDVHAPRVVLRDGSVATVRAATDADRDAMRRFFHELSPESRRKRFFTAGEPPAALIERLCDVVDPARGVTLVAERHVDGDVRLIAVGSYAALTAGVAEAAFAVDDRFQGKGLGTALLERLAAIAAGHGFRRFEATTLADNNAMLEVFRDSGFEVRSKSAAGCVEVQLSLTPSVEGVASAEERSRVATAASLRPMLEPRSVAVVGASRDPTSIGRRVLDALIAAGFSGPIYPINPHAAEIGGRKAFPSVRDLPPGVDLAVIAVPQPAVLGVVDDCAAAGVKSLVVITAGFAETGAEGRALQQALVEKVRGYGMRMVGPNCMGLLNTRADVRLNASFSPVFPPTGHIAFSSQSGALGLTILELAAKRQASASRRLSASATRPTCRATICSSTGRAIRDRRHPALPRVVRQSAPVRAPRAAHRPTQSRSSPSRPGARAPASRAAGSHTAALAASDVAVDALFHQSGVIRADTIDEMFDIAACLDAQPLPAGRRVAIVTNAGGPGILAVDACEAAGLTVTEFSAETRARLAAFLPSVASVGNPVDVVASASGDDYRRAIEVALTADESDALIVIFTPVDASRSAEIQAAIRDGVAAGRRAGATRKPILACVMADPGRVVPLDVGGEHVPTYAFPENAARALGKIATYATWRAQPPGLFWGFDDVHPEVARDVCRKALNDEARARPATAGWDRRRLRGAERIRASLAAGAVAHTADEAAALASVLGFPVAAKLTLAPDSTQDRDRRRPPESRQRARRAQGVQPTSWRARGSSRRPRRSTAS